MYEYKPMCGDHIGRTAAHITHLAYIRREPVSADFNGVTLVADVADGYTADEQAAVNESDWAAAAAPRIAAMVRSYHEEMQRRADAYRASPEGIRAEAERAAKVARLRALIVECMAMLPTIDLRDHEAAIRWLLRLEPAWDDMDAPLPRAEITAALTAAGYVANDCCKPNYVAGDKAVEARYIIGQVLENLGSMGAIHGICGVFAQRWLDANGGAA